MTASAESQSISLRTSISPATLLGSREAPEIIALGSFWQQKGELPVESRIAKLVKLPVRDWVELLAQECVHRAFAQLIAEAVSLAKPAALVRVLASAETAPQPELPMSRLACLVCENLGIRDETDVFSKTQPRPPLRFVPNLGGEEALEDRMRSVLRYLQISPRRLPERVLLLDDILTLGASARVYSAALRRFCSVWSVTSVNIAAVRFAGGQDAWRAKSDNREMREMASKALELANEHWLSHPRHKEAPQLFDRVWMEKTASVLHYAPDCCPSGKETVWFLAHREGDDCPRCSPTISRSFWQRLFGGKN